MKIVSLAAENFKRLRAIMIKPDGSTVIVGGKNGAGKSSALDAIRAALGGKKHCPDEPVRRGAKKAQIVLETDELTVTRTFSKKGTQLEVTAKDGEDGGPFPSPQAMLDKLVGTLSFDPLEFSRMDGAKQSEVVRRLAGLDFADLDARRAKLYPERTMIGRDVKTAKTLLDNIPIVEAPEAEVSISDAMAELTRRRAVNNENITARNELEDMRRGDALLTEEIASLRDGLSRMVADGEREIQKLKDGLAKLITDEEGGIADTEKRQIRQRNSGKDLAAKVEKLKDEDTDEIEFKIAGAEEVNAKVRLVAKRKEAAQDHEKHTAEFAALTRQIEDIDEQKAEAIQSAKYPIDGLEVTDDGVRLDGLPWAQASSAQQLRCSVGMGLALNPELKVLLVKDGSYLDEDNLQLIAEMATAAEAQVWIERVGKGDECTVIIEDGSIESRPID